MEFGFSEVRPSGRFSTVPDRKSRLKYKKKYYFDSDEDDDDDKPKE